MQKWAEAQIPRPRRSTSAFQKLTCLAFYWLPVRRMAILARLEARIRKAGACVVLDLEDGLWFPDHPAKTEACRAAARDELRRGAGLLRRLSGSMAIGIRVNPEATWECMLDLETLASIGVEWSCIFL